MIFCTSHIEMVVFFSMFRRTSTNKILKFLILIIFFFFTFYYSYLALWHINSNENELFFSSTQLLTHSEWMCECYVCCDLWMLFYIVLIFGLRLRPFDLFAARIEQHTKNIENLQMKWKKLENQRNKFANQRFGAQFLFFMFNYYCSTKIVDNGNDQS